MLDLRVGSSTELHGAYDTYDEVLGTYGFGSTWRDPGLNSASPSLELPPSNSKCK